ncbi:MAG: hypothetical protein WEB05_07905 [Solirubrobacterales bacterium]
MKQNEGSWWRPLAVPLVVAGVLSAFYLITAPLSADHAAQMFRAELFRESGPALWNNYWFGGHYLPAYSLFAPAVSSWIGFRVMGVISVMGTVTLFSLIVDRRWGAQARTGAIWFAAAATVSLYSGRLTFALGVLLGTAVVFAAQRGSRLFSLALAAMVAFASPVAALFLACCGFAHWVSSLLAGGRDRRGLEIAVVSFLSAGLISLFFPGGGDMPYALTSFLPAIALTLVAAALVPVRERLVRTGLLVYAAALSVTFLLDTPMGGNVNRLGLLLVGPLFLCTWWGVETRPGRRALVFTALLPLLALWQLYPVIRDLNLVRDEPAVAAGFYEQVERILVPRLDRNPARVEVLPLASHWESARIPPEIPLARGWERQTDRRLNGLFYTDRLDPQRYRGWLEDLAVAYVAVPRAKLDYAAEAEVRLIERGLPFLREIPSGPDWKLYRVVGAAPLVQPPARMSSFEADGFSLDIPRPGTYLVRIRATPYWTVESGSGCVGRRKDGWTEVSTTTPGTVEVRARFSPVARFRDGSNCGA